MSSWDSLPISYRVLLDTNVILDAVCPERPESQEAMRVLHRCNGAGDMGIVLPTSLNDAYCIMRKRNGESGARAAIDQLMGLLVIASFGGEECDLSLHSNEPDFEDGLMRACAELNDVDFILTRDKKAFAHSKVKSLSCSEYLELVEA